MMYYTATYSPEDNKLRLSATSRLDAETYARVKAAGFIWAPKQDLFVAPMWTPSRADLLIELAGEIGDEDTSLVDRAEQRADRFTDYSESRAEDAESARRGVEQITSGIPMGQPILVGHHSERHARKDAEKIENGMRRAVKMWETASYWKSRAAGAIRHAKYKELPAVRARRIKTIEAEKRSHERDIERAETFTKAWSASLAWNPEERVLTREQAMAIANYDRACSGMCFSLADFPRNPPASQYEGAMGLWSALKGDVITPEQARTFALKSHAATITHAKRWLDHVNNRLEYERAMLAEGGGLKADAFDIQVGGQVKRRGEWLVVTKLNKRDGVLNSVSVVGHWASTVPVEEIQEYKAPAEGDSDKVKAATKLQPLCNFRTEGCIEMTTAEWKRCMKCSGTYYVAEFTAEGTYTSRWSDNRKPAAYRQRTASGRGSQNYTRIPVFLTDAKVVEAPKVAQPKASLPERELGDSERPTYRTPEPTAFDAIREQLKAGVQVVSAPQLFPTPLDLARRMVDEAGIQDGDSILEPSAGTGNIMRACAGRNCTGVAVEVSPSLSNSLAAQFMTWKVRQADFLQCNGDLGKFDRILMNPPFADGADIEHVTHAYKFLKPGGRLVAIMCEGPFFRQDRKATAFRDWLESVGGTSEQLPADTFESSGTGVQTRLVVMQS